MAEHLASQVIEDTLPNPLHRVLLNVVHNPVHDRYGHEQAEYPPETYEVSGQDVVVYSDLDDPGHRDLSAGVYQHRHGGDGSEQLERGDVRQETDDHTLIVNRFRTPPRRGARAWRCGFQTPRGIPSSAFIPPSHFGPHPHLTARRPEPATRSLASPLLGA